MLRRLLEIMDLNAGNLESLDAETKSMAKMCRDYSHSTDSAVDLLLDETKRLLMMPCSSMLEGYPLLVRQLSRELGREVDFSMSGGDIEVDKRILADMKDPLTHIVRNSLDHGIETPEARVAAGKPARAKLSLKVSQLDGSQIEIRVSDDGRGVDQRKVVETAIKAGMVTQDETARMSPAELNMLIFRPSLSTSPIITEVSGRGIGLAIVEEKIKQLGGKVKLETEPGRSCTFIITLPVSIATSRGVLVDVLAKTFVLPTTTIDRVVRTRKDEIKPVEGQNTMLLGDSLIPVCRMEDVLKLPASASPAANELLTVVVLGTGNRRVGFVVDEILEEQELLVKSPGQVLSKVPNISGVTILGSGKVVPILNVNDMIGTSARYTAASAWKDQTARGGATRTAVSTSGNSTKKVLVVDDTLTARILLRNIFESAGFATRTANDGMDALSLLQAESFDAVVTDIEMPRMNGFDLTAKIRSSAKFSALPVIMVTSTTSKEDRERGVAVGANAYFVKSSFDQSNLLEVINTLV